MHYLEVQPLEGTKARNPSGCHILGPVFVKGVEAGTSLEVQQENLMGKQKYKKN